jgi:hypothetical protein
MFPTGTWPINAGPKVNVAGDTNSPAACESGRIIPPFAIFVSSRLLAIPRSAVLPTFITSWASRSSLTRNFFAQCNGRSCSSERQRVQRLSFSRLPWLGLLHEFNAPHKELVHHGSPFPDRGGARLRNIDVRAVTCLAGSSSAMALLGRRRLRDNACLLAKRDSARSRLW